MFYLVHPELPIYGVAGTSNGTTPSPWNSLAPDGQPIPVPAPIPASAWKGISLLGGLGVARVICRRQQA